MLNLLRGAWDFFSASGSGPEEPWATDEEAFGNHFGIDYEEYASRVADLDRAHVQLYEKTMELNPEAAVLWVIFITQLE